MFVTCNISENGSSHKCCMIFVDEHARVYQNWTEFKTHNEYPPGYLVTPAVGVYKTVDVVDSNNLNRVLLDIFPTPSSKKSSKLAAKAGMFNKLIRIIMLFKYLNCIVVDKISTVGGLAAAGVCIQSKIYNLLFQHTLTIL